MSLDLNGDELANEVRMRAVDHKGFFLLVEGCTDESFFRAMLALGDTVLIPSFGFSNVLNAIAVLDADQFTRALGVIDRDYHGIVNAAPTSPNVIMTDDRDVEVFLFGSVAFERVLKEFASAPKLAKEPDGVTSIRAKVSLAAIHLAKLRFVSARNGSIYSFVEIDCDKFVVKKTLEVDQDKLLAHVRGISHKNAAIASSVFDDADADLAKINPPLTANRLCRGHDLFTLTAIGLRTLWGNYSSSQMRGEQIEKIVRLACDKAEFRATNFAGRLIGWFASKGVAV